MSFLRRAAAFAFGFVRAVFEHPRVRQAVVTVAECVAKVVVAAIRAAVV